MHYFWLSVCVERALAWMRSCPFKIVCWIQVMACIRQFQHHFTIYGFANNVHRVNDCWLNNTKIFVFLPLFIRCGGRAHFFKCLCPINYNIGFAYISDAIGVLRQNSYALEWHFNQTRSLCSARFTNFRSV